MGDAVQRVMIVGQPGSGKSWLALQIGRRLGLPVYHMDHIHWQAGWVERDGAEKLRLCAQVEALDHWVFEGNFTATAPNRTARADLVIWLDLPVGLRLWRVTWRLITGFGRRRPDMAQGCPERLGRETVSFYRYICATRTTGRARIAGVLAGVPQVARLRNPAQVTRFLAALK